MQLVEGQRDAKWSNIAKCGQLFSNNQEFATNREERERERESLRSRIFQDEDAEIHQSFSTAERVQVIASQLKWENYPFRMLLLMEEILHRLRWLNICTIIYRVLYIPGGAGFLPSTVWVKAFICFKKIDFCYLDTPCHSCEENKNCNSTHAVQSSRSKC